VADWRQIRARIRRAKAGPDAAARLQQLFDKTRDGMVAFELAELEELAGQIERATDWYKQAWQRFRRSEWKKKAEEALARHGVPLPAELAEEEPPKPPPAEKRKTPVAVQAERITEPEGPEEETEAAAAPETEAPGEAEAEAAPETAKATTAEGKAHRRRRRGGRGRGRGRGKGRAAAPAEAEAAKPAEPAPEPAPTPAPSPRAKEPERRPAPERRAAPERRPAREPAPAIRVYRRVGEPALASEIKSLEAKLRQLLAAHPCGLEQIDELPASPGVYVVSDLDLTTIYYVETYGNIRAAVEQLLSGRRGRQGSVRARLARYLGIGDSQATRYLKQHCVVRWLEFEETDAIALGHFAIALLRPELNEEAA
jgi:hypothetical protein